MSCKKKKKTVKVSAFHLPCGSWFLTAEEGSVRALHFNQDPETSLQDDLPVTEQKFTSIPCCCVCPTSIWGYLSKDKKDTEHMISMGNTIDTLLLVDTKAEKSEDSTKSLCLMQVVW